MSPPKHDVEGASVSRNPTELLQSPCSRTKHARKIIRLTGTVVARLRSPAGARKLLAPKVQPLVPYKSTSSGIMLNPMRDKKIEGKNRGGEKGRHL